MLPEDTSMVDLTSSIETILKRFSSLSITTSLFVSIEFKLTPDFIFRRIPFSTKDLDITSISIFLTELFLSNNFSLFFSLIAE